MNSPHWMLTVWLWLFQFAGILLFLAGAAYLIRLAWRLKRAQTADGMVIGFDTRTDGGGEEAVFLRVCFKYRQREYTVTGSTALPDPDAYDLGQKVQVFFPPQQPEAADIKSFYGTWWSGLVLLCLGAAFWFFAWLGA